MANAITYRFAADSGQEKHGEFQKTVAGTAGVCLVKTAIDTDAADFGGAITGNILNAAGGSGAAALGSLVSCEAKSLAVFKIEYSASTGTRRFRVVFKDFNATIGYVLRPEIYEPANLGLNGASTPVLATLVTAYFHGEAIIVPCLGMKEATLLLLAGESNTVHAWISAI